MDVKKFWKENWDGVRVPLVLMFEEYYLFGALPETVSKQYYTDLEYRHACEKKFNNLAEQEIGIRPFNEEKLIYMKGALEVRLGAQRIVDSGETAWIHPAVQSKEELSGWITKTAELDLRNDPVPEDWKSEGDFFTEKTGIPVTYGPGTTGPVTMAAALLGTTELCMWSMDYPELIADFFQVLCQKQIEFNEGVSLMEGNEIKRTGMRNRPLEFSTEKGEKLPVLMEQLSLTADETREVLNKLEEATEHALFCLQYTENHFAFHAGQLVLLRKLAEPGFLLYN
jgi:hypothetical protein